MGLLYQDLIFPAELPPGVTRPDVETADFRGEYPFVAAGP
jgi:hypothetical protein